MFNVSIFFLLSFGYFSNCFFVRLKRTKKDSRVRLSWWVGKSSHKGKPQPKTNNLVATYLQLLFCHKKSGNFFVAIFLPQLFCHNFFATAFLPQLFTTHCCFAPPNTTAAPNRPRYRPPKPRQNSDYEPTCTAGGKGSAFALSAK